MKKKQFVFPKYVCFGCGKVKRIGKSYINGQSYCSRCATFVRRENELKEVLKTTSLEKERSREARNNCRILGTCGILEVHHTIMQADPERLSTDFLVKLICGTEKHAEYLKAKAKRVPVIPVIPMELYETQ